MSAKSQIALIVNIVCAVSNKGTGLKLCKYMPVYYCDLLCGGTYCDEKSSSCRHDFLSSGVPISVSFFISFSLGFL